MGPEDGEKSYKLFLSMDIAGSTELKNTLNLERRSENIPLLELIETAALTEKDAPLLKSLDDWGRIQADLFENFHTSFFNYLEKLNYYSKKSNYNKVILWKTLGDEMVFVCTIKDRVQIHKIVTAFSLSLIFWDKHYYEKYNLRLKGTVWGAEFPIRNRILKLPKEPGDSNLHNNEVEIEADFFEEYVGPDIDIGFRLGKETCPGLLTVSMDIITLLGETSGNRQVECCLVKYVQLKGVWNNLDYPIFWARANNNKINEFSELSFSKPYIISNEKFKKASKYKKNITNIRDQLPKTLGLFKPFLPLTDKIPEKYEKLLEIYSKYISIQSGSSIDKKEPESTEEQFIALLKEIEMKLRK